MNILSFDYNVDTVTSRCTVTINFDSGSLAFILSGEELTLENKTTIEQEFRNAFVICDTIPDVIRYMILKGHRLEI